MRRWYKRYLRNQLHLVLSLLIVCVVMATAVFILFNLYTLSATSNLIRDQEQIIYFSHLLNNSHQTITRYAYTGDTSDKEVFETNVQELLDASHALADQYASPYVYSLEQVTALYAREGKNLQYEQNNSSSMLVNYNRVKSLRHTLDFFLPYAQSAIADEVSQELTQLGEKQRVLMFYALILFVPLCLFGFAVIMHIMDRIVVSLELLTSFAEKVGHALWDTDLPAQVTQREDELGILSRTMISMSQTIHAQMKEIQLKADLEQQYRQKEHEVLESGLQLANMRLKHLQDQIRPHFLFNCLNMITKLAFIEDAPRCQKATELIARYLREVLDRSVDTSTLGDEFTCVQDYCRIQEMRFGARFSFDLNCEENCKGLHMPSMCLQPLVENAFIHGLDKCARRGWIHCNAYQEDDFVIICVEDNGAGLTSERIDWIHQEIASADMSLPSAQHIGLIGTVKRMQYFFGSRLELNIESDPGILTRISLKVPFKKS